MKRTAQGALKATAHVVRAVNPLRALKRTLSTDSSTWLICGLGNPGAKFTKTKHNVGFDVIDEVVARCGGEYASERKALVARVTFDATSCVVCKPQTFMNLSGKSVSQLMRAYRIPKERVVIVYDDLDTNLGEMKVKLTGSHGGHNGIRSIIDDATNGSRDFPRVKIGIGRPSDVNVPIYEYVLSRFSESEDVKIREAVREAADVVKDIVKDGRVNDVMTRVNTKYAPKKPAKPAKQAKPPKERVFVTTAVEGESVKVTVDVRVPGKPNAKKPVVVEGKQTPVTP
jgi:PTH1 family peptidyl-tRNA hydrolase